MRAMALPDTNNILSQFSIKEVSKMNDQIMVRVPRAIVERYRETHPKLKGLTYTAVVEVMMREALQRS